ncbi:MAG: dihydrofolate reductase [Euryarchaeota archaeon]|nr:dihydrofolate reductase [Euryarchaeota archaeon]
MRTCLIAAVSENGFIGVNGDLPWKIRSDMIRFRDLTVGGGGERNAVIMGRKTWDSLPDAHRPLSDRVNIVLTKQIGWEKDGAETAFYPGQAMEIAFSEGCEEAWIIGGAGTYSALFDLVDEVHLTTIHADVKGDVKMPEWDQSTWTEQVVEQLEKSDNDEYASSYSIWKKR